MSVRKAFVDLGDEVLELSFGHEEARLGTFDVGVDVVEVPLSVLDLAVVEDRSGEGLRPLLADELIRELADCCKRREFEITRSCFATALVKSEVNACNVQ